MFDPGSILAAIMGTAAATAPEAAAVSMGTLTTAATIEAIPAAAAGATAAAGSSLTPWLLGGSLALGAATAGMGYLSTQEQKEAAYEAAEKQGLAGKEAAEVGMGQAAEQAAIGRAKRISQARLLQSRLRAAAGEAGIGTGGTYQAINRQIAYDTAINQDILARRLAQNYRISRAGFASQLAGVGSFAASPIVEAFLAGMQGTTTGLAIGTNIAAMPGVIK